MAVCHRYGLFLVGCLVAGMLSAAEPAASADDLRALEGIKKRITAGDWKGAYQAAQQLTGADGPGKGRRTPRLGAFEWNYFTSYLQTAANYPDTHVSQKRERARAAQMLGLFDVALLHYELTIQLAADEGDRHSARSDLAMCAYWAALEATAARDYDRAAKLLDRMRDNGITWVKEAGQQKAELVRKLLANPKDVAFRIEFAQKFWLDNVPALGSDPVRASRFLLDTLKFEPTKEQRLQIYARLQGYAQQQGNAAAAEEFASRIAQEFAGQEAVDEAFFTLAQFHFQKQEFARARDFLLPLAKSGRANRWVPMAQLGLAETYARLKDEPAMLQWLEKAATAQPIPTNRSIMDTSDTRQTAIQRLGGYYQDRGDYQKALGYFTRWEPRSWCGTCLMSMRQSRNQAITLCHLHLGDHAAAVRQCLGHAGTFDESPNPANRLLFELYRDAGQLDDLLQLVKGQTGPFTELVRIHRLGEKQDVAALVAICQDCEPRWRDTPEERTRDWRCKAAAEALANGGGKEIAAIRTGLATRGKSRSWLIYALGRSPSADSLPLLAKLAQEADVWVNGDGNNLCFAIHIKGKAGKELLAQLANGPDQQRGWAQSWLRKDSASAAVPTWPRPKPGSLPTRFEK